MLKRAKLQTKLLVCGILLTILPLLVTSLIVLRQNGKMVKVADEESSKATYSDLDHVAGSIYELCRIQQESLQQSVNHSLNVARHVLQRAGELHFAPETVAWDAVDQFTNVASKVELPKMMVGATWLDKITDMSKPALVVDTVQDLAGGTCTLFQRMNEAGDMLRVCTNVQKKDGARAIGTYIPRTNADGKPNPVIAAVLRGETYHGRAVVVGSWYTAAYEPILDASNKVVGMLYVGIPQDNGTSFRTSVMGIKLGKTGYVYILDSKGNYIISAGGKRDGECIWESKDANGSLFIQDICKKALALKPGEIAEQRYPWKNEGDSVAREKVVRLAYFEPWDWVIGAGAYTDEVFQARILISALGQRSDVILGIVLLVGFLAAAVIWFVVARGLAGRIHRIVALLSEGAEQVSSASSQVSAASQSLAEGATEAARQAIPLDQSEHDLESFNN